MACGMLYLMFSYALKKNVIVTEVSADTVTAQEPETETVPASYHWKLDLGKADIESINLVCPEIIAAGQYSVVCRYDLERIRVEITGFSAESMKDCQPFGDFEFVTEGSGYSEDGRAVFTFDTDRVCEGSAEFEGNTLKISIVPFEKDERPVVMLDAGHGGTSTGTRAGNLAEKDVTLSICRAAAKLAEDKPYRIMLTRNSDESISTVERLKICEILQANAYIGIHLSQDIDAPDKYGLQSSYNKLYFDRHITNSEFAGTVLRHTCISANNKALGVFEAGEEDAVLEAFSIPAAILYAGYMTNAEELKLLENNTYIQMLAAGIVNALDELYEAGSLAE